VLHEFQRTNTTIPHVVMNEDCKNYKQEVRAAPLDHLSPFPLKVAVGD
jgi:hypothetical protein